MRIKKDKMILLKLNKMNTQCDKDGESQDVVGFKRKFALIQFIKSLQKSLRQKGLILGRYFFILRMSYKFFIGKLNQSIRWSHLKTAELLHNNKNNVKGFFIKTKRGRAVRKVMKIRTDGMKRKIILFLQKIVFLSKMKSKLFCLYEKYFLKRLKGTLQMRSNVLKFRTEMTQMRKLLIITKLKKFSVLEAEESEIDRRIRKFQYMCHTKYFYKKAKHHTNLQGKVNFVHLCKKYFSQLIYSRFKSFALERLSNKLKYEAMLNEKKKCFLKRISFRIEKKSTLKTKIGNLDRIVKKKIFKEMFLQLDQYSKFVLSEEIKINRTFQLKQVLNRLRVTAQEKNLSINFQTKQNISKLIKIAHSQYFSLFYLKTKFIRRKKLISLKVNEGSNKIRMSLHFSKLKCFYFRKLETKNKNFTALFSYRNKLLIKALTCLKIYLTCQRRKKESYAQIKMEREKIINTKLIELLITNCTRNIKHKEDQITRILVKKSEVGIKTALNWYKKLKGLVQAKKTTQQGALKKQLQVSPQKVNLKDIKDDVEVLITLKNKIRKPPISYTQLFN